MAFYRFRWIFSIAVMLALLLSACRPEVLSSPTGQSQGTDETIPDGAPTDESLVDEPLMDELISCEPTRPDSLGPFYEVDAPIRDRVGEGYVLFGSVLSAEDCLGITGAQIEIWLAGPDGEYRDEYRATLFSDDQGEYRFESHFPPPYQGRPSHIHVRVTAPGFQELVTQHYPEAGDEQATFNLVLIPVQ